MIQGYDVAAAIRGWHYFAQKSVFCPWYAGGLFWPEELTLVLYHAAAELLFGFSGSEVEVLFTVAAGENKFSGAGVPTDFHT